MQSCTREGRATPCGTPSASLDDLGNNRASASAVERRTDWVHWRWRRSRGRIRCALDPRCEDRAPAETPEQTEALDKRCLRLKLCGTCPIMWESDSGLPFVVWGHCRDRMCPRCQEERARKVRGRVRDLVSTYNAPRFMTLTLAPDGSGLAARLSKLLRSYRELRRRRSFREYVSAGVAAIEIVLNRETREWHVHLHAVVDGDYFPQQLLSDEWRSVTGDSYIVDIRSVKDRNATSDYIAKYVSKAVDIHAWPPGAVREYAIATTGRRVLITSGLSHACNVDPRKIVDLPRAKRVLARCNDIISWALAGDENAKAAVELSRLLGPQYARAFGVDVVDNWCSTDYPSAYDYELFVRYLWAAGPTRVVRVT